VEIIVNIMRMRVIQLCCVMSQMKTGDFVYVISLLQILFLTHKYSSIASRSIKFTTFICFLDSAVGWGRAFPSNAIHCCASDSAATDRVFSKLGTGSEGRPLDINSDDHFMSPSFVIASLLSFVLSSIVLFFPMIAGFDKGSHTNVKNSMKKSLKPPLVTVLNLNLSRERLFE
jgi:hypothetical protein